MAPRNKTTSPRPSLDRAPAGRRSNRGSTKEKTEEATKKQAEREAVAFPATPRSAPKVDTSSPDVSDFGTPQAASTPKHDESLAIAPRIEAQPAVNPSVAQISAASATIAQSPSSGLAVGTRTAVSKPVETLLTPSGLRVLATPSRRLKSPNALPVGWNSPLPPDDASVWESPRFDDASVWESPRFGTSAAPPAESSEGPRKRQKTTQDQSSQRAVHDSSAPSPAPRIPPPFKVIRITQGGATEDIHVFADVLAHYSAVVRDQLKADPFSTMPIEAIGFDKCTIMRYIQCFSPNPRIDLPTFDWVEVDVGTPGSVAAPVMGEKRPNVGDGKCAPRCVKFPQQTAYKLVPIEWDMDSLWDLYYLALWLQTPSVCDMVVDKWISYVKERDAHLERVQYQFPEFVQSGLETARLAAVKKEDRPTFHDVWETDVAYINRLWQPEAPEPNAPASAPMEVNGARRFWVQLFLSDPEEAQKYFEKYNMCDFAPGFLQEFVPYAFEAPNRDPGWENPKNLDVKGYDAFHCAEYHDHTDRFYCGEEGSSMMQFCYEQQWEDWFQMITPEQRLAATPRLALRGTSKARRAHKFAVRRRARAMSA
ncbi:hypothetical protein BU16DRAFT_584539 [Lophium mytilinum]|uniref:Uncharacterized protein n=1 Tax=Lophium mytilinum TaxID=390894 RepID=A0A6A6QNH9_9PEZI|nr:hypothetical protein BU16DRAFT_584539 [Lophium mytilinum]